MRSASLFLLAWAAVAQVPNPTQQRALTPKETGQPMPIFRVTVVSRSTRAINYHHRAGSTRVDFKGTELMPEARGDAKVESQMGSTKIETRMEHMSPASQYGPEFMTFVLWAITPEGRAHNLGEIALNGDDGRLLSTTDLQTFGLIVTAEPYFAVTQPSDVVVAENFARNDTTGTMETVNVKYELLQRGQYVLNRSAYHAIQYDRKGPLQLAEAENAIEIARLAGAEQYAPDTLQKAVIGAQNARGFLTSGRDRKAAETNAREAAQMAEDARIITIKKRNEEQLAAERAASAEREAAAQSAARQAQEQSARAEADRLAANQAQRDAEAAAQRAAQERAAADAAKAQALAQQQQAQAEAERARLAAQQAQAEADRAKLTAQQAESEKAALRERLRQQLSMILETRETARGIIVNISDVLFDFNKYTLKPGAREKLAKVAGILLSYPSLKIQLEGHTDSIGTDEYNMKLSQQRADSVREYLRGQGVASDNLTATGLGKDGPVASNDTAAGRQQNRRVEMVVSGDAIGALN